MKRSHLLDFFQRHLSGGGYLFRVAFARGAPFLETANDDEKRRHNQQRKAGRGEHAAEHRDTDRLARIGAGAGCEHQRQHAQDKRERSHEDGAEAGPRRLERRLDDRLAIEYAPLARHFYDQDRVLGRERNQQHETDLSVEVVANTEPLENHNRPHQGERHRKQHRDRHEPAFVLAREHQIHEQHRERENVIDLVADQLFLVRHRAPFVPRAGGRRFAGDLLHQRHRLTGTETGGGQSDHGRRRVEIVEAQQRWPDYRGNTNHRPERDHGALLVADRKQLDVLGAQAELRIRLHIDLEDAPELVELVDIARPQISPERREHVVDADLQRLGLGTVHIHLQLRHGGTKRARHALQTALRVCVLHHRIGRCLQFGEIEAAVKQLQLHGKATGIADALDRRRWKYDDARLCYGGEVSIELLEQRKQVLTLATLAPILEH